MEKKKLTLIWKDLLMEQGGFETVKSLKGNYANNSVGTLVNLVFYLLDKEKENQPSRFILYTGKYLPQPEDIVVYSCDELDYKELLIALVTLMYLINIEDRPSLIVNLAHGLQELDQEISQRFARDIAEKVYRKYR